MILALLLAQTAAIPLPAAPEASRWSILAQPNCPASAPEGPIIVCAPATAPRLPLPAERGPPDRPMPSNPDMSAMVAMGGGPNPCSAHQEGCTTGIDFVGAGVAAVRLVGKLIDRDSCCERPGEATNPLMLVGDAIRGTKRAFAKKPDKSKRIPIVLDDMP